MGNNNQKQASKAPSKPSTNTGVGQNSLQASPRTADKKRSSATGDGRPRQNSTSAREGAKRSVARGGSRQDSRGGASLDIAQALDRKPSSSSSSGAPRIAALPGSQREMIQACFENPHSDLGGRIYKRVFEKRPDFQAFYNQIGSETWAGLTQQLTFFLDDVVAGVGDMDGVAQLASDYGARHVDLKAAGFKPDFWVGMADAMTTECMYLDHAVHSATDVIEAWSGLVSVIFAQMRDGYYARLRRERRLSRRLSGNARPYREGSTGS